MSLAANISPSLAPLVAAARRGFLSRLSGFLEGRSVLAQPRLLLRKSAEASLLEAIRAIDYSGHSDAGLRAALASLGWKSKGCDPEIMLPRVFALVDETIQRRLGAWRLFDAANGCGQLERYRSLATRVVEATDRRTRMSLVDGTCLDFAYFYRECGPLLDTTGLDDDERLIVAVLIYVRYATPARYQWDIHLPAEFYRALANKDSSGALAFRPTNEQLLAGVQLFRGRIVEMNAGEGKTVAAAFPAVLHALLGRRVHIATANDYLAARDLALLGPVYRTLGLTADAVLEHMAPEERRDAYSKAIVYGNLREFGFDFLRDNLKLSQEDQVQGPLEVVIVDEADHALIDQAQTPMIISGGRGLNRRAFSRTKKAVMELIALQEVAARQVGQQVLKSRPDSKEELTLLAKLMLAQPGGGIVPGRFAGKPKLRRTVLSRIFPDGSDCPDEALTSGFYYFVDPERRYVALTQQGQVFLETQLGTFFDGQELERQLSELTIDSSLALARRRREAARLTKQLALRYNLGNQVYQMLRALLLLKRNLDYIVTEDSVVLIDPHTGRTLPDNQYREGLQSALEAKEGVKLNPERQTLGQISVQGFVNRYGVVSGMTGTARAAASEFRQRYSLSVATVPGSRPLLRQDLPSRVYATRSEKQAAIVEEVAEGRMVGRPVLVGAESIQQAEEISRLLSERQIPHHLLTAITSHQEAEIVRNAGGYGAVTVATNMAGRGTDIILDGQLDRQVTTAYLARVDRLLLEGASWVTLRCYTGEEAAYLCSQASAQPGMEVARLGCTAGQHLLALRRAGTPPQPEPDQERSLEFGLGLYVIGAEINGSPRVDLQLQGRSGRQGSYGWSRFFLSLEDLVLSFQLGTSLYGFRPDRVDSGGRPYLQGKHWENGCRAAQQQADREAEHGRNLFQDYSNLLDTQTELYYLRRNKVMRAGSMMELCQAIAGDVGAWLAGQHFPGNEVEHYTSRFNQMGEEAWEDYGVDCAPLLGVGLDQLSERFADGLVGQLNHTRGRTGIEGFERLAKTLWLQTGDEVWRDHLGRLQELILVAAAGSYGHKSAVSDYVIESFDKWKSFRLEADRRFLSRLLTFPVDEQSAELTEDTGQVNLVPDAVAILS